MIRRTLSFPDSRQAILNLAQAYRDTGEAELAEGILSRGLELMPGDPNLLLAPVGRPTTGGTS